MTARHDRSGREAKRDAAADRDAGRPRFTISGLLLTMLVVSVFGAAGAAAELLWGMAWLSLAPALLLLIAVFQYPLMRRLGRAIDELCPKDEG